MKYNQTKKEIAGKKFNLLLAISEEPLRDNHNKIRWYCLCDCGNYTTVVRWSLLSGRTKSCGCLSRKFVDITGERFGRLVVIKKAPDNKFNQVQWEYRCDCGNITIARGSAMRTNKTLSCGCLRRFMSIQASTRHGQCRRGQITQEYLMWNRARQRAKKFNVPFSLSLEDIVIPKTCPIFDTPLIVNRGGKCLSPDSPSIDRIVPELGYTKENTWIISMRANTLKSNFSFEQLENLVEKLREKIRTIIVADKICA